MKFVRLAAIVLATALVVQAPAHADLVLASGPNQGSFTNNFGFGADGTGSATNPNADYYTGPNVGSETFGPHLDSGANPHTAPVAILFVFGSNGAISTYTDKTVGAYDNVEDTQIGVLNLSGGTLNSMQLSATHSGVFGFDGDGISSGTSGGYAAGAGAPGNSSDPSKYGGPMTYFTLLNGSKIGASGSSTLIANANFIGGLASGDSTYFSLEGTPSDLSDLGGGSAVPEPASMVMAATGALTLLGYGWRRRKIAQKK